MKLADPTILACVLEENAESLGAFDTTLRRTVQRDRSVKWKVVQGATVMGHAGHWEHEPLPSNRTEDFLRRTRFGSPEEALAAWEAHGR